MILASYMSVLLIKCLSLMQLLWTVYQKQILLVAALPGSCKTDTAEVGVDSQSAQSADYTHVTGDLSGWH